MPTKSLYLDDETDLIANEVMSDSGYKISHLFRHFLQLWKSAEGQLSNLAVVQDCSLLPITGNNSLLNILGNIDPQKIKKIFLMGVSMHSAIINNKSNWENFLDNGGHLQVILQGDMKDINSKTIAAISQLRRVSIEELLQRRRMSENMLLQLRCSVNPSNAGYLEIKESGDILLTYSAIVIWKCDKASSVDVQIHPYVAGYKFNRGARFIISTSESSRSYSALVKPLADLWDSSRTI